MIYALTQNIIKEKQTELIEETFNRECSLYFVCKETTLFILFLNSIKVIIFGHVRMFVTLTIIRL